MGFIGLVPTEHSSGSVTRRGHLTKTGNAAVRTQLIQSAWAYQHRPAVGAALTRRQEGLDPQTIARAWAAQQQLCRRFRTLDARKPARKVVVAAIARELAGLRYRQILWMGSGGQAASFDPWVLLSTRFPSLNSMPAWTRATSSGLLTFRHRSWAASSSL